MEITLLLDEGKISKDKISEIIESCSKEIVYVNDRLKENYIDENDE